MQKLYLVFFVVFLCFSFLVNGQDITGKWYGTGTVKMATESNNYLTEIILKKRGNKIVGFFNFYFRDSLFSNTIEGIYNAATRKLILQKQPIIFYTSSSTKNGIDCFLKSDFTFKVSKVEQSLTGILYADDDTKFTCPEIYFNLKREQPITTFLNEKIDTITQKNNIVKEKEIEKSVAEILFEERFKKVAKTIDVADNKLILELYDNGQIDGDIVSVFLDGKPIILKHLLSNKPFIKVIDLDTSKNEFELSLFAENMGLIAPNTAALTITNGKQKFELVLDSDLKTNASIILKRKQPIQTN